MPALDRGTTPASPERQRSIETCKHAIRQSFAFLKQTSRLDDLFAKSIPLEGGEGYLLPVCELHADSDAMIATLARWRAENAEAFPTRFPVTNAGTAAWLRARLLDVEDRLLFLVVDKHGAPVGHLGVAGAINDARELEVDNVVRGVKSGNPGIMAGAMRALLSWAQESFGPESIFLRVFSDNAHAIAFYRRLSFSGDQLLPLRAHVHGDTVSYEPLAAGDLNAPDKTFLRMVYTPAMIAGGQELILTAGPSISAREASYGLDAVRYGWNAHWSDYILRFEAAFARYVGAKHALSTSSCTGALHLALAALGIGPGDEVVVPDLTWVATANAVSYVGATPVFADVEPRSWCLDAGAFAAAITPRTRAVIPVHLYGHPARMDAIMAIARRHRLQVVEDAAPAIGAEVEGRRVGTFGDFAAFSFQGAKLLVTGEGGMLVTNDDALYARARSLWDQGRDPARGFWINETGVKYKLSNVQAAIGLAQLERVDELIEAKRRIFSWYEEGLHGVPWISLNHEQPWARSIYWMTSILLDDQAPVTRDAVREALLRRNVDTRPLFPAISQYPIWGREQHINPTALRLGRQGINLPSGVRLQRPQVEYVSRCLREILPA